VNSSYQSSIVVDPTNSITPTSLVLNVTPADSAGNVGSQFASTSKTTLQTTVSGSAASVTLTGGTANDLLYTNHNGDILIGGAGSDDIYIASNTAATVKINAATDSTTASYDTVTGFGSDDTLNISTLVSGAGYTETTYRTGPYTPLFAFENATINQTTRVASTDVVYRGTSAILGEADFQMKFSDSGITGSSTTNHASGWTIVPSTLEVGGFVVAGANDAVLSNGSKVFTISFTLPTNDTSYLFSTSTISSGTAQLGSSIKNISPVFVGTPTSGQLQFVNDGTTLGTVTDNTLHFSQDSSFGVHIKYDTNSAIGALSISSEIYITGFTSTIQNLVVL
jgi:hypothetical protein